MKRSEINDIMAAADDMIRSHGFTLPPFAYWTPDDFAARVDPHVPGLELLAGRDVDDLGVELSESEIQEEADRYQESLKDRLY